MLLTEHYPLEHVRGPASRNLRTVSWELNGVCVDCEIHLAIENTEDLGTTVLYLSVHLQIYAHTIKHAKSMIGALRKKVDCVANSSIGVIGSNCFV